MLRYAILVDVGYVYGATADALFGRSSRRGDYRVDAAGLVGALRTHAAEQIDGDLLRVYWYDAAADRVHTVEQRIIGAQDGIKVRLGNLTAHGQKGVDALLRTDLEALARNHAVTDVILISGDEDMLGAVEAAQTYGVRVHLWGIEPPYGSNQSERLVWEADSTTVLPPQDFAEYFTARVRPPAPAPEPAPAATAEPVPVAASPIPTPVELFGGSRPKPAPPKPLGVGHPKPVPDMDSDEYYATGEHVAHTWFVTRGRDFFGELLPGPLLPHVIDRELLTEAERLLGRSVRDDEEHRRRIRGGFWERVYREFGTTSS
jgi:uncharacterized LabA/DUF88 family protein